MQLHGATTLANTINPFQPAARVTSPLVAVDNPNTTLPPVEASPEMAAVQDATSRVSDTVSFQQSQARRDSSGSSEGGEGQGAEQDSSDHSEEESAGPDPARSRAEPADRDGGDNARIAERQRQELELRLIQQLSARDREVRQHEQAHVRVGGRYAGAPSYQYERGPNGLSYAVSGEVPIDVAPVANDPLATIRKMEQVRHAALAPAEPSAQDRAVAAMATRQMLKAKAELANSRGTEDRSSERSPPGETRAMAAYRRLSDQGAEAESRPQLSITA